jgi:hypothetical protein
MLKYLKIIQEVLRQEGMGYVLFRLYLYLVHRLGILERKFPRKNWEEVQLGHVLKPGAPAEAESYLQYRRAHASHFFYAPADQSEYGPILAQILGPAGLEALKREAENIGQGRLTYFSRKEAPGELGMPPNWFLNPFTGETCLHGVHWSRIPNTWGDTDIKFIWEPSRFASAYTLSRAYWATGDEVHAETFWQLVESWREANPPNTGPNWKCGQESSLKIMAWCFGLYATLNSAAATPERVARLAIMIEQLAQRIDGFTDYARSQRNNHYVSEGLGLWTVALLFPEMKNSGRWREKGRRIVEEAAAMLLNEDGTCIQESINYHRVVLQGLLWGVRLGQLNDCPLSDGLVSRVEKSFAFMHQFMDGASGMCPNFGANDGALILPLSSCEYPDFRPTLALGKWITSRDRVLPEGPWDEMVLWMNGPEILDQTVTETAGVSSAYPEGGLHILRGSNSWAMFRCKEFTRRPGDWDLLHVDLWAGGVNLAQDAGSYLYYGPPPWNNALKKTRYHNTLTLDDQDQMTPGPGFLSLDLARGQVTRRAEHDDGSVEIVEGQHDGFRRIAPEALHRRGVMRLGDSAFLVVDDVVVTGHHSVNLHWLLADGFQDWDEAQLSGALEVGNVCFGVKLGVMTGGRETRGRLARGSEEEKPL